MIVQLSNTGADGSWKDVLTIEADKIPADEAPFEPERSWDYPFPAAVPGRFVRLFFPDGDQPQAKYDGYICLGEVQIDAPGLAPQLVSIEGAFGKVEVNVTRPSWTRLYLRGVGRTGPGIPAGRLLADARGPGALAPTWWPKMANATRAGWPSRRRWRSVPEGGRNVLQLTGVKLVSAADEPPVATEDWTLERPRRRLANWSGRSRVVGSAISRPSAPAARACSSPLTPDTGRTPTTSTLWYDPLRIAAGESTLYALVSMPGRISENHLQTIRDRDTWAIYKLWTNWHAPADLRLEVQGGHLYRRGSFAFLSEAGAVTGLAPQQSHRAGEVEEITLKIGAVDKHATGYQLADQPAGQGDGGRAARTSTARSSTAGRSTIRKAFDFGNETDGWYYAGSCWMYGATLAAGTPAAGPLSAHPYDAARAFREHLAHVLSTLDEQGRAHFGYNQGGEWVDDNLHTIIGTRFYLLHSGDLALRSPVSARPGTHARLLRPAPRSQRAVQARRRRARTGTTTPSRTSGVNGYYNAFFYKAACDLAEMEARGRTRPAGRASTANWPTSIKTAFNRVFWKEDAPGGPRYLDWIDAQGNEVSYFCDLCQWPPIAVGIASPEQARKIVATADARIAELEKEYGYPGYAGLSALWPVPQHLNPHAWQTFGRYMNGGSLLCQTYWEIVARARAGDAAGAARRLKQFAQRAAETHWAGDNAANIQGEMANGDGEPYLADMVAVTAAAVHGVLGIEPTWERLDVTPRLPADWPRAEADVLYKGRRHHVTD